MITPRGATDVDELFVAGQTALRQGRPAQAAELFDRVVRHDPDGPFGERGLFQGALAREASADLDAAALRFEELSRRFPTRDRGSEALVRALRLRLHLEQWQRADQLGALFLESRPNAAPAGRILAYAGRGLGSLAGGRQEEAEYFVAKGLQIVDELALDRAGRIPRDLAQLYFALGETRGKRALGLKLDVPVAAFPAQLEKRCELLLTAQSAYSDAMRAYDAHWSAVAGYRVGELYERLHAELMNIPVPAGKGERQQQLFEGAMRLRYSVLLTKASSMMDHTVMLARRTGEQSAWVRRAEASQQKLARALQDEERAIDRLPFTRQDLQAAMDDLAHRSAEASASAPAASSPGPAAPK